MIEELLNKYLLNEATVSSEIYNQLGGNKFVTMTGAKNFIKTDISLSFKIPKGKNGINYVKITLTPSDAYDIEFGKVYGLNYKVISHLKEIYADKLGEVFTEMTGLYTSLYKENLTVDDVLCEDNWSGDVKAKWHPPEGLFTKSAEDIAKGLKKGARSYGKASRRLTFYINRAGKNLSKERRDTLDKAKEVLKKLYGVTEE